MACTVPFSVRHSMSLCCEIKLLKYEATHSCLTAILGQGLDFKRIRLSDLTYHFSIYLLMYVIFNLCKIMVAYQLLILGTLKKKRKLENKPLMAKMYRCGKLFLWINYSRIRPVRLEKNPWNLSIWPPSRNSNKYFTNVFLCYVTALFIFCGL